MVLIVTFLVVNGPECSMEWIAQTFLNHFLFAGLLYRTFVFLSVTCVSLLFKTLMSCLL